jgi:uncharacterized protein (DUF2235 family)
MRNIALFSDGTGNSAGKLQKTNVWRLYKALNLTGRTEDEPEQVAYYDDGVGSSSFKLFAVIGGVFGWGLKRNVIDIYTFLCRNYDHEEKKDRIYCFGFSRGAFTIRVLADFVATEGLVNPERAGSESELRHMATDAFRSYRRKYGKKWQIHIRAFRWIRDLALKALGRLDYDKTKNTEIAEIAFLGLWDTVDAYGLPIEELTEAFSWFYPLTLPDRKPSNKLQRVCHALALDDERQTFEPVLLNEACLATETLYPSVDNIRDERVSQVWFSGVHSNVGGGYPDDALSLVSLNWMVDQAEHSELKFWKHGRERLREADNPEGRIYDSRRGLAGFYRYKPRKIELLKNDREHAVFIDHIKVHDSVFQRIRNCPEYSPIVLPEDYVVVDSEGRINDPVENVGGPTAVGAEDRAEMRRGIWNLVWWRRVVYFASAGAAIWLALFPLIHESTGTCEGSFCFLGSIIRGAELVLPGFAAYWFDAYESHPGTFFIAVAILAALLWTGGWLQRTIRDQMQILWQAGGQKDPALREVPQQGFLLSWLLKFPRVDTHRWYRRLIRGVKKLLVILFGILMVLLVAVGVIRLGFGMMSSSGMVCETPDSAPTPQQSVTGKLHSQSLCQATGYQVQKGKRYRITLSVNGEWRDCTLEADLRGIRSDQDISLLMKLAVPIRRHLSEPWFTPIARVGSYGRDEYPLDPVAYHVVPESGTRLVSEIVPRASGELFLFVNDAVLPLPKDWQRFYRNNRGTADVTIEPVIGAEP